MPAPRAALPAAAMPHPGRDQQRARSAEPSFARRSETVCMTPSSDEEEELGVRAAKCMRSRSLQHPRGASALLGRAVLDASVSLRRNPPRLVKQEDVVKIESGDEDYPHPRQGQPKVKSVPELPRAPGSSSSASSSNAIPATRSAARHPDGITGTVVWERSRTPRRPLEPAAKKCPRRPVSPQRGEPGGVAPALQTRTSLPTSSSKPTVFPLVLADCMSQQRARHDLRLPPTPAPLAAASRRPAMPKRLFKEESSKAEDTPVAEEQRPPVPRGSSRDQRALEERIRFLRKLALIEAKIADAKEREVRAEMEKKLLKEQAARCERETLKRIYERRCSEKPQRLLSAPIRQASVLRTLSAPARTPSRSPAPMRRQATRRPAPASPSSSPSPPRRRKPSSSLPAPQPPKKVTRARAVEEERSKAAAESARNRVIEEEMRKAAAEAAHTERRKTAEDRRAALSERGLQAERLGRDLQEEQRRAAESQRVAPVEGLRVPPVEGLRVRNKKGRLATVQRVVDSRDMVVRFDDDGKEDKRWISNFVTLDGGIPLQPPPAKRKSGDDGRRTQPASSIPGGTDEDDAEGPCPPPTLLKFVPAQSSGRSVPPERNLGPQEKPISTDKAEDLYGMGFSILTKMGQVHGEPLGNKPDALSSCVHASRKYSTRKGIGFAPSSSSQAAPRPAQQRGRDPPECVDCKQRKWPAWKNKKGNWHCGFCHRPHGGRPQCHKCGTYTWDGWNGPASHNREWWCAECWCQDQEEEGKGAEEWDKWFELRRQEYPDAFEDDGPELWIQPSKKQRKEAAAAGREPSPYRGVRPTEPGDEAAVVRRDMPDSIEPHKCIWCKQTRWPARKSNAGKWHCGYCDRPKEGRPQCDRCEIRTWNGNHGRKEGNTKPWLCAECWCADSKLGTKSWRTFFADRLKAFPEAFADNGPELFPISKAERKAQQQPQQQMRRPTEPTALKSIAPHQCNRCKKYRWPGRISNKGKYSCGYCDKPKYGQPKCSRCTNCTWDGKEGGKGEGGRRLWICGRCWCEDPGLVHPAGVEAWKKWFWTRMMKYRDEFDHGGRDMRVLGDDRTAPQYPPGHEELPLEINDPEDGVLLLCRWHLRPDTTSSSSSSSVRA